MATVSSSTGTCRAGSSSTDQFMARLAHWQPRHPIAEPEAPTVICCGMKMADDTCDASGEERLHARPVLQLSHGGVCVSGLGGRRVLQRCKSCES